MSDYFKLLKHFRIIGPVAEELKGIHETYQANKLPQKEYPDGFPLRFEDLWFIKKVANLFSAQLEVSAQELIRLISPHHPKTRIVKENDQYYVGSKGVKNNDRFTKSDLKQVAQGELVGLGEILILALLLNEVDLKFPNLLVQNKKLVTKIDGDWCFAHLKKDLPGTNPNIEKKDIKRLPFIQLYYAYNWLDIVRKGLYFASSELPSDFAFNENFRKEINQTLLKITLLPDYFFAIFIEQYISACDPNFQLIVQEIVDRKNQLTKAIEKNKSYQSYVLSSEAEQYLNEYISSLKQFKTTGKNILLLNPALGNLILDLQSQFDNIRGKVVREPNAEPKYFGFGLNHLSLSQGLNYKKTFFGLDIPKNSTIEVNQKIEDNLELS